MASFYEEHAQKLYDSARANNNLNAVYNDLNIFKDGVGGEMSFIQMMTRESVPNTKKEQFLRDIIHLFQLETQRFFDAFISEANFEYIYRAIKEFEVIYKKHHLIITSAVVLNSDQVESIVTKLSKKMEQNIYTYDVLVDTAVIGGIKVQSYDYIIDATVLSKLKSFKQTI